MTKHNIESVIKQFRNDSQPEQRYTSFDYCYNYFRLNENLTQDIEKSCLILGFYLASWGMFRGSSFLLQKSSKHFEPTIKYIASLDKSIWEIDVDNYNDENIETIISVYKNIKKHLIPNNNTDLTLVTKVLLGVFGFIPAFDQYFCNTFREIFKESKCGFRSVNSQSLNCIKQFYIDNKEMIDKLSDEIYTKDFTTGNSTIFKYPKAKIIDMYGFTVR
ncbi:hypothetical protein [Flavobacterium aestuarii]|uniref:hypothetical protein n=1 Tax=Flavobacterium aestuarii TaxID=3149227 RepID=UPI0032B3A7B3